METMITGELRSMLAGAMREDAVRFVEDYLIAGGMAPRLWFGSAGYWRVPYGKNYLCGIVINENRLRFWFFAGDYGREAGGDLARAAREHATQCVSCSGDDCPKGAGMDIFGERFSNLCFQFPIQFENPGEGDYESIRGLIEYYKEVAALSDSWHSS